MRLRILGVAVAAALGATAGFVYLAQADDDTVVASPTTTVAPATTTTEAPTTAPPPPTTAAPTTTTTEPPPPPPTYSRGDEAPEITEVQRRLAELGYWLPEVDGRYGLLTSQAVMAFQKHEGLTRDGVAGPQTLGALDAAAPVVPRDSNGHHMEIDLARQLLFLVHDGGTLAFNTSTGRSGWRTPPGEFTVTRQIDGMRRAPLGDLWRPKYFNRGIAVHGSPSVPGHPASHGCARLTNRAIDFLWDAGLLPPGTRVSVY